MICQSSRFEKMKEQKSRGRWNKRENIKWEMQKGRVNLHTVAMPDFKDAIIT